MCILVSARTTRVLVAFSIVNFVFPPCEGAHTLSIQHAHGVLLLLMFR